MTSTVRPPNPTIVMTSPPAHASASRHPRRPPAHRSVSLLHSPPKAHLARPKPHTLSSSGSDVPNRAPDSTYTDSPSSLQALRGKNSSGESSNADKWFEKSNNEVRENTISFADNDPPFFMRNSSSSETPPDAQRRPLKQFPEQSERADSLPFRTDLLQLGTDASSTDDFRSVIDDLTIENKKLKRRLKKYEKLHDAHLKDEKLFEVRIHGLPTEKKRELEDMLRKFASSLGTTTGANAFPANGYASLLPLLKATRGVSSQASMQIPDSAYASMSASGQGSSAQSGNDAKQKTTPTNYAAARRQDIHSYLHYIPEGLTAPQNPSTMTERAKKRLVVRRLEQIFAGRGAAVGGHQQPIQQQEVSQSAARADRSAIEAAGQRARQEGSREASIMKKDTDESFGVPREGDGQTSKAPGAELTSKRRKRITPHETQAGSPSGPNSEQRPTRPLDIDPNRAQVPAENIRYMRHLGFSPRDPGAGGSPEEGHSWIYLNFLINMAQLHTLNVTADFVLKALGEHSHKFEISSDNRKVRWQGGQSVTRNTSTNGSSSNSRTSDNTSDRESPRKRPKLTHKHTATSSATGGHQQASSANQRLRSENNKYVYTPLFSHRDSSDDTDDSSSEEEEGDVSSPFATQMKGDSSGMTSSGIRTSSGFPATLPSKKRQRRDDGPIIFYNNARFCTDLSGDRRPIGNSSAPTYIKASATPIGKLLSKEKVLEKRGPLAEASQLPEPMDLSDNPIPEAMEVSFPPRSPPRASSQPDQKPVEMEVTGIGGVWPSDNFSISVQSRHTRIDPDEDQEPSVASGKWPVSPRLEKLFGNSSVAQKKSSGLRNEVVASKFHDLPPSKLPPALAFMPFEDEFMDEDENESGNEEDESEPLESSGALPPAAAPQPVDILYASSDEDDDEDASDVSDEEEESDDGEVDFLAAAREVDPEAVRQKEREYDAAMAERLAEEIPAGSSAATAGGGSGYASPASGVAMADHVRATKEAHGRHSALKRAAIGESNVVQDTTDTSSSGENEGGTMSDVRS